MKISRIIIGSIIILCSIISTFDVNAALIDNGDGTITDTDTNLMWLQDVNYAMTSGYDADGLMFLNDANVWAENLVFAGYDDWRLPSLNGLYCGGMNACLGSELGDLYYSSLEYDLGGADKSGPFIGLTDWSEFWFGDRWIDGPWDSVYVFSPYGGFQGFYPPGGVEDYAWAVRNLSVVPEPISSTLFIVGAATLGFRRFRKKIKN